MVAILEERMIIGKDNKGNNVSIDLHNLIETKLLIQANSGGGKSWLLRKLLEESHGKVQQIIFDLEGEFSTLREKYDYLLVGKGGDIEIDIKTAKLLARKLLELGVSTIIDLSELKKHERMLYVKRFVDSMVDAPKKLWHPCIVVVDETHQFAPEKGKSESSSSIIDLATRGRKRGYCLWSATQRLSKLNKDVGAECNNKLIGRTGLDIDMKRASDELGFTSKQQMIELRHLESGEFFGFGTAISKEIIKVKVGQVKTSHPRVGQKALLYAPKPTDKIKKILEKITDLPKEAQEELRTIDDMKRKIRELQFELRKKPKPEVDKEKIQEQTIKAFNKGLYEGKEINKSQIKLLEKQNMAFESSINNAIKILGHKIPTGMSIVTEKTEKTIEKTYKNPEIVHVNDRAKVDVSDYVQTSSEKVFSKCAKRIYNFLYANNNRGFTKIQIGAMVGYSPKSGSFNNAISELNSNSLIQKNGENISINDINQELIVEGEEFSIDLIKKKLPKCPKEIFNLLLQHPDTEFSKEEIGEYTGYSHTSGSFNNGISKLNSLGFIEKIGASIKLSTYIKEL